MAMAKRLLLGFWTVVAGAVLACALLPATALAADVELAVTYNDNAEGAMDTAIADALAAQGAPAKATVTVIKVTGAATDITDGNWEALRACFTADSGWDALKYLNFRVMPNIESVGFTSSASTSEPSKLVKASFSWDGAQPKTIGNHAFRNCANLYDISFGNIVETIGDGAFYGCKTLTLSDLPDSVKSIGKEAFRGCKSLRLSEMPDNAETVSDGAFQGCTDLKRMKFPAKVKTIGSRAFDIAYSDGTSHYLTQLTFVGAAPTSVAADAFGSYSAGMLICEEGNASGFDEEWMKSAFGDNASNWSVNVSNWPFTVRGGVKDQDWSWSDNNTVLTIRTATPVTVSGVATALNTIEEKNVRIVVDCGEGATANVTLSSVNIKTDKGSALQVLSGALDLKLETAHIAAQNPVKLVSSAGAGIEHGTHPLTLSVTNANEEITIESTNGGAGIGGVDVDGRRDAGNFTLSAGASKTITAKGAPGCAGIGGAKGGSATNMSFTEDGAALDVTGGAGAAGIGGGEGGSASNMQFAVDRGRTVAATGGGAGIGGGKGGDASDLLFEDGTYELTVAGGGAGVGAGSGGSASNIVIQEGGGAPKTSCDFKVTGTPAFSDGVEITAGFFGDGDKSQGTVYDFKVAEGYAVVDSGFKSHPYKVVSAENPFAVEGGTEGSDWSYDIANSTLNVLTAKPLTISMADGVSVTDACIQVECPTVDDTAHLAINGVNIDRYVSAPAFGVKRGKLELELVGDNVLASPHSCGLGNANEIDNKLVLTIFGEGSLVAKGGDGGAGIGGHSNGKTDNDIRSIESITIKGGTITASGFHCGIGGAGAGFGGGVGEGGRIVIEGGTVTAEGQQATGIGSGSTDKPAEVVITGGKVTAKGAKAAIDAGAKISGGHFGAGDATAQTVYGIAPQEGFKVWANEGDDKDAYPVYVAKASTLTLKQNVEKLYTGSKLTTGDVLEAAEYGTADATADVKFSFRVPGAQDNWIDGLPKMPGTWDVTATLPAKTVDGVLYASATDTTMVTIRALPVPANPTAEAIDASSATVRWGAAEGATSYRVQYREKGEEAWFNVESLGLSSMLTGLNPGTAYEWQVRAIFYNDKDFASEWTDLVEFTTDLMESPLKSATVTPAEAVAEAGEEVELTVAPNAEVDGFALAYQWQESVDGAWVDVAGGTGASISVDVSADKPARTLRCKVTASKDGYADASVESASGVVILAGLPSELTVSDVTTEGAALAWTDATNATGYKVGYRAEGDGAWTVAGMTEGTSFALSGLKDATSYEWGVKAVYADGTESAHVHGPAFTTKGFVPLTSVEVAPASSTVDTGTAVALTATTNLDGEQGVELAYQWQRLADGTWEDVGDNARAYSTAAPAAGTSDTYRCQVTASKEGLEPTTLVSNEAVVSANPPAVYPVVEGDKSTWEQDADGGARFKIDAPLEKLVSVSVDGAPLVEGRDYDASSGSTVIVLRPAYLATLTVGEHTLDVTFTDGSSQAAFTIEGATGPESKPGSDPGTKPSTGEAKKLAPTGDPLALALGGTAALAALAAGVLVLVRKRG